MGAEHADDRRWTLLVVAMVCVHVALSLWFTRHGAPLPPDTMEYAEVARNVVRGRGYTVNLVEIHPGLLPSIRHLHELHGLLQPLLLVPLFAVSPSAALVGVPGVFFIGGIAIACHRIAQQAFGPVAGVIAAALVLGNDTLADSALLGTDDVGCTFFSAAVIAFFLRAIQPGASAARWLVAAGACSALGVLQKLSGVVLPAVLVLFTLITPGPRRVVGPRGVIALVFPSVVASCLYLLRNYLLHGRFGFRFSGIDWLGKVDVYRYFAFYPAGMTVQMAWKTLGAWKVFSLTLGQFGLLRTVVHGEPFMYVLGVPALILLLGRGVLFARLAVFYAGALVVVVCTAHHVEARYLLPLLPLFTVAISGVVAIYVDRISSALREERWRRRFLHGASVAGALTFVVAAGHVFWREAKMGTMIEQGLPCTQAFAYLRRSVDANDSILTASPWYVTWMTERPSVMMPTNGVTRVLTVAEHYRARWALSGVESFASADVESTLRQIAERHDGMAPRVVFEDAPCKVYALMQR